MLTPCLYIDSPTLCRRPHLVGAMMVSAGLGTSSSPHCVWCNHHRTLRGVAGRSFQAWVTTCSEIRAQHMLHDSPVLVRLYLRELLGLGLSENTNTHEYRNIMFVILYCFLKTLLIFNLYSTCVRRNTCQWNNISSCLQYRNTLQCITL